MTLVLGCHLCVDCQDQETREVAVVKHLVRMHQWLQGRVVMSPMTSDPLFCLLAVLVMTVPVLRGHSVVSKEVGGEH
jgi:hypothetical protein